MEADSLTRQTPHFLVVDDAPDSLDTIVEYLRSMGHERISTASDGAEALRLLDADPTIDFIISDWDMPGVNGLSLLQQVRSHPLRSHLPFLIATSPISQETEKVLLAAENLVDAYVIKPFRSEVLREKISEVLASPVHGPQKQVVVVDDDEDSRAMVLEYLQAMGFKKVIAFPDAKSCLGHLQENSGSVGLIISDWEMSEMSGIELLQACRNRAPLAAIPFLIITGQHWMDDADEIQSACSAADEFLLKPFPSRDLKLRITQMLAEKHARAKVERLVAEGRNHLEHLRTSRAFQAFETALTLDPQSEPALTGAGDALLKSRGPEPAIPFFVRAVDACPLEPRSYLRLAAAYEQLGCIDSAIALLQLALSRIDSDPDLHFHLGRLFNRKGLGLQARGHFERTLELQLTHREARLMLEMLTRALGQG